MGLFYKALIALALLSIVNVSGDGLYEILDEVDFVGMKNNATVLQSYFECLTYDKGCDEQIIKVRDIMPEVVETCCEKCTENQKQNLFLMRDFVLKIKPEMMLEYLKKYDPTGEYTAACLDKLELREAKLRNSEKTKM